MKQATGNLLENLRRKANAKGKRLVAELRNQGYLQVSKFTSEVQQRNMNRASIRAEVYQEANETWKVGKRIGMVSICNDEAIIDKLVDMEERDILQHLEAQEVCGSYRSFSMWIASFNIRGLSGRIKNHVIWSLIKKNEKLDFICIQETKLEFVNSVLCQSLWGNSEVEWCFKESNGRSGGLLCLWDMKIFDLQETFVRNGFLGVKGK